MTPDRAALAAALGRWLVGASPAAGSADLDVATLLELRTFMARERLIGVIADFFTEGPARLAEIRDAIARGDVPDAVERIHALKGPAGFLGATRFHALCQEVELRGRQDGHLTLADAGALASTFASTHEALLAAVRLAS